MTTISPILRVHYKSAVRDKTALFFTFAFPLLFIVVFGLLFGSTKTENGHTVMDSLAPGVLAWGVGNAAVFGLGYNLVQWRATDLLRLIRRTPTPVVTFLASRFIVILGIAGVQAALFLAVASIPPFDLRVSALGLIASIPVLICGTLAFFSIGLIVGNLARTPDAVAAIANCLMVPMAFLSGSFYPISESPAWLRVASYVLPLRYMNDGLVAVLTGGRDYGTVAVSCAALLGFAIVFSALAIRGFRWENAR